MIAHKTYDSFKVWTRRLQKGLAESATNERASDADGLLDRELVAE